MTQEFVFDGGSSRQLLEEASPMRLWGRRCLHEQLQHIAEVDGATRRKM